MSIMIVSSMLYKDIIVALVVLCCLPMEKLINRRYILRAKIKLSSMTDLHKIGITGSVGKTSVKRYLTTLLSGQKVFASPKSFN
ncbi:MAG: UDP-N-acetylmuramoyl-tripeptide--D-alanyl-D-alanine ligase, partial [Clostridia bacterium]|nr:UDP-N-acetylmuramoyl-tripeptide--D-alanyl-D-alanine ligase [Clostridia bacterium]